MPRFFFDFRQYGETTQDDIGLELLDVEHAYLEAFKASVDMWSELLRERCDPRRCSFEVRSEANEHLFAFPFQEALDVCVNREIASKLGDVFHKLTTTRNFAAKTRSEFREELEATRNTLSDSHRILKSI